MNKKWHFQSSDSAPLFALLGLLMNVPAIRLVYDYVNRSEDQKTAFFISVIIGIFVLNYFIFEVLILPKIYRWTLGTVFYVNLIVLYFMTHYKVVMDKDVAISMAQTTLHETSEYMTIPYTALLIFGLLGVVCVSRKIQINFLGPKKETRRKSLTLLFLMALFALNLSLFIKDYAFFFRQQKVFKHLVLPLNYMDAIYGGIETSLLKRKTLGNIHSSSHLNPAVWLGVKQKSVYVLVIGETARAQSFSLDGYVRKTNPRLERIPDLVSFFHASSCGTSTSVSVPCIFDFRGREKFVSSNEGFTNLLDMAKNSGFEVTWIDNNTGCQHVCDRVTQFPLTTLPEAKSLCADGTCYDELLVHGLKKVLKDTTHSKNLIILHMLGSHGPKYYKRYPRDQALFQPDCRGDDLGSCTQQEIVNSYDNTILYTDSVLANIVDSLKGLIEWNANFVYISDHGESLGEKGLYLHAMPFRFAPEEQTHVPFLFWANPSFLKSFGYNLECIKNEKNLTVSHNHIFHSYLRLMGIDSPYYLEERDLFKNCLLPRKARPHN